MAVEARSWRPSPSIVVSPSSVQERGVAASGRPGSAARTRATSPRGSRSPSASCRPTTLPSAAKVSDESPRSIDESLPTRQHREFLAVGAGHVDQFQRAAFEVEPAGGGETGWRRRAPAWHRASIDRRAGVAALCPTSVAVPLATVHLVEVGDARREREGVAGARRRSSSCWRRPTPPLIASEHHGRAAADRRACCCRRCPCRCPCRSSCRRSCRCWSIVSLSAPSWIAGVGRATALDQPAGLVDDRDGEWPLASPLATIAELLSSDDHGRRRGS